VGGFQDRLDLAVKELRRVQSDDDGGWGAIPAMPGPRNVVNTAHALAVLRAAHKNRVGDVHYEDDSIQRGIRYIADKAPRHWQPVVEGGDVEARGAKTRYAAYGLLGLTTWPETFNEEWIVDAQCKCIDWLSEHEMRFGGWREIVSAELDDDPDAVEAVERRPRRSAAPQSLLVTPVAVRALSRIPRGHPRASEAADLATGGRNIIRMRARDSRNKACWPQEPDEAEGSVSTTGLAVLALANGTPDDRALAKRGVDWLLSRTTWWHLPEVAADAPGSNWHHMTFSLALRAVLFNGSGVDSTHDSLQETVRFIDALWNEDDWGWSHGRVGSRASTTGTHAAVMAHEALRRAWPFDAVEHILGSSGRQRRRFARDFAPEADVRVSVHGDGRVTVSELDGDEVTCVLPSRDRGLFSMFLFLASKHEAGNPQQDLATQSATAAEIAAHCGISVSSVRTYATRINTRLRKAADEQGARVGELIVPASDAPEAERLWRLAAWSVDVPTSAAHSD
jgi:hypothetical protein